MSSPGRTMSVRSMHRLNNPRVHTLPDQNQDPCYSQHSGQNDDVMQDQIQLRAQMIASQINGSQNRQKSAHSSFKAESQELTGTHRQQPFNATFMEHMERERKDQDNIELLQHFKK
jgi:hypothetical protein